MYHTKLATQCRIPHYIISIEFHVGSYKLIVKKKRGLKKISVIPPLFQAYDYVMFAAMMITRILLTIYPYNGENGLTLAKAFWRAHFPSPYLWAFGHKYGLQMVIQTCRIQQWAWQILAYRFNYITFTLQARYFSPTEKDFLTNLLFGATVFIFEGFLVFVFF